MAEPIGWMERYALAADRSETLGEMIPGSDDFFFYHCLHFQTTGQLERSESILADWLAEHKGKETAAITAMLDRQRLLTYEQSPERTIDHLVRRLGIKLDHAPPATRDQRRFPSSLDPSTIEVERLIKDALNRNDDLKPPAMRYLAARFQRGKTAGFRISLHDFVARISTPLIDGLDDLVIKELSARAKNDKRFGDLRAHSLLTLDELRNVAAKVPEVADDNEFVAATLQRMRSSADSDPTGEADVRIDYLTRIEAYLRTLPPSYHSMKAAATYRLLEANLGRGVFDRELFLRYLQLPRISPIVHPEWVRRSTVQANLNDDYMAIALLPPIRDEEPVVRTHLEHFLKDAKTSDAFAPYLQPDYLRRVFAETKLLEGIGPEAQWYKLLSAVQRQAIRDSVELRLVPTNPETYSADEPTTVVVDIKNVDELIVRIYEINTESYYRTNEKRLDTDIDLDGLVATHEKKLTYGQSATRRHRESLSLDEISGRGVWVVDLVGKGVRARALIRRGSIDHADFHTANGMAFTIIDENRRPIPTATMWVGSREFVADEEGRIVVPPMVESTQRGAVISDGMIARQIKFTHLSEQYRLVAGMYLNRAQLQSGGRAELLIRPRLMMDHLPIDPKSLSNVSVRVESKDLENISTTTQFDDLELEQTGELVVPIRVPSRLAELTVTLSAKIDGLADRQERSLSTSRTWDVAGIRRTRHTHDAFLTRDGDDYVIEVRGRNGERIPRASVRIRLSTQWRNAPVEQTLQTDDAGRVALGKLSGVTDIRYSVVSGLDHHADLELRKASWPNEIYSTTDQMIQLPLVELVEDAKTAYRLLEIRGGAYRADQSDRISIESGLLVIRGLPAGDFQLINLTTAAVTQIAIVDGPKMGGVAVGKTRHRSISPATPLSISEVIRDADGLKVQLSGDTDLARVHLYGSRYFDRSMPFEQLDLPMPELSGRGVSILKCGYVSDLRLGDEYQYVLRRRYTPKYPGVMLPQPGVILNPWETEETSNESQSVAEGDAVPATSAPAKEWQSQREKRQEIAAMGAVASDYDFLADPGVALTNLRPDEKGVVRVPADVIEGLPILQVLAVDPATLVQHTVAGPLENAKTVDLRLAKALEAKTPLSMERAVMIASPDQPLDLQSLGSAQLQVFGSVESLLKLYKTLVNDPRLDDFDQLANWHTLDRNAKLNAYSRLASHELHLFLWSHDRSFFAEVVQPYLENKKEKQFVDHWLLGDDLKPYIRLWSYNQLSSAERALLAIRLPESRESIRRELREVVDQQEVDHDVIRRGIESALKSSSARLNEALDFAAPSDDFSMLGRDSLGANSLNLGFERGSKDEDSLRRLSRTEEFKKRPMNLSRGEANEKRMFGDRVRTLREEAPAFYRDLDSTKQWAESQWDRVRTVRGPLPASLIGINGFWSDLAASEAEKIVVSTNLLRPIDNRHAALVSLAFCGLPLSAGDIGLPTEPDKMYKPAHAVAVVTKRLRELQAADAASSLLIGQRFEAADDADRTSSRKQQAVEPSEFLTGVAYRGQTVVSNPTAERRVVDVFWQLPAGSLPLSGSQTTDSSTITLQPFEVEAVQYDFYFPAAGEFTHYPATVADDGKLIARGPAKALKVVDQPTQQNAVTWETIARTGTPAQIEAFLANANLREIDWMLVAHRMPDQDVYRVIIETLDQAKLPIIELWAYAMKHRDEASMQTYLSLREDLVARVGPVLSSPLLVVEPIERRLHELLEYAPLVRARIHRLGDENEILNPTFLAQYRDFTRVLGYANQIDNHQRLVLTYYLLIQNRIADAIETFGMIDRNAIATKLQYDYLEAYLAMHRENFDQAERIARSHSEYPIPRWNVRFSQLLTQLNQRRDLNHTERLVSIEPNTNDEPIAEGSGDLAVMDRERQQAAASDQQPEVIVRVEGDSLKIDHRRAQAATLNFYGVDLELLFSKAPFVREDLQRMAMVRQMRRENLEFDGSTGVARFDLDENLRRQTLLVEVVSGASRSTALSYGGEITTYVSESFGQLQTTDASSHRPISTAYVKVYAKYPDGSVRFYKDGYTDSRGRFDYASVSASDARGASRYAILVLNEEKGATLHDVAAPGN